RGPVPGSSSPFVSRQRIEAPYLQLILQRLWSEDASSRVLCVDTLRRLGGAEQIVHDHLSNAMGGLLPEEQQIAAKVFHYLVTPSGTKVAYTAEDLAGYAGVPQPQVRKLLERLSAAESRILSPVAGPPDRPSEPRFEIY